MKYLGFPISEKRFRARVFNNIADKMRRRLQPWKGKNITSGVSGIHPGYPYQEG
jgi:hypothetical protein